MWRFYLTRNELEVVSLSLNLSNVGSRSNVYTYIPTLVTAGKCQQLQVYNCLSKFSSPFCVPRNSTRLPRRKINLRRERERERERQTVDRQAVTNNWEQTHFQILINLDQDFLSGNFLTLYPLKILYMLYILYIILFRMSQAFSNWLILLYSNQKYF